MKRVVSVGRETLRRRKGFMGVGNRQKIFRGGGGCVSRRNSLFEWGGEMNLVTTWTLSIQVA